MKSTIIEFNVSTGEEIVKEIELTEEQVLEMEHQQLISQANHRIQEIKTELQGMDYMTSKIIDGDYTDEEVANIKATRTALRDEINLLEDKLHELGVI